MVETFLFAPYNDGTDKEVVNVLAENLALLRNIRGMTQAAAISAPRQIFFISKAFPPKKAGTDLKFAAESCIVTTI